MNRSLRLALTLALASIPPMLFSNSTGPVVRVSGAPGDATCNQFGCHLGPDVNTAGGSLTLTAASPFYTPGQTQLLTLTIKDAKAKVYGFQASARLDSDPVIKQAGTFTPGAQQLVKCDNSILRGPKGCPSIYPVEFLEHGSPSLSNTIEVNWTAPAADSGPLTIYVAANAANGDGSDGGDHIYTASLQLLPPPKPPAISSNGVVGATAFKPASGAAPGTLLEIYGSNLAATTRNWQASDFKLGIAPALLDRVSVTIGGKAAFVAYVDSKQVNVEVPDGIAIGPGVSLVVTNAFGSSAPYLLTTAAVAPAILAPAAFAVNGTQYAFAILPPADPANPGNPIFALPTGAIAGVESRPARPGEILTLYGIGFGPVTPATPSGTLSIGATALQSSFQALLGQTPAATPYAGLAPGFTGLYQINLTVPTLAPGDYPLDLLLGSSLITTGASIRVGQ